eukprot:CAMPEP_0114571144 /NCGR_PEP_ID=MMETSP0114-20121206/17592_1 /TAXON_ID=31324 /ORGANISM="Goniomonas sp, Strain m" /LENGTH=34 /DNA_ID= /DNA_START= /DNA_END= /DNA_ORIENTATION=
MRPRGEHELVSVGTLMFRYTASDAAAPVWPTGLS